MSDLDVATRTILMNGECWLGTKRPRPIRHIVGICLVGGSKCVIVRRPAGRVIRRIHAVNSAGARDSVPSTNAAARAISLVPSTQITLETYPIC